MDRGAGGIRRGVNADMNADAFRHFYEYHFAENRKMRDEMLFEKPITKPDEDKDLIVWQVLLHVVNHGTDHRAQILRLLNDLGVKTGPQDYIFYVYDHLMV